MPFEKEGLVFVAGPDDRRALVEPKLLHDAMHVLKRLADITTNWLIANGSNLLIFWHIILDRLKVRMFEFTIS